MLVLYVSKIRYSTKYICIVPCNIISLVYYKYFIYIYIYISLTFSLFVIKLFRYVPPQVYQDDLPQKNVGDMVEGTANLQSVAQFTMVYYMGYLGYLTSGRICSLPLLCASEKCMLPQLFATGQPNYQLMIMDMIILKLRWPASKLHLIENTMCIKIKNLLR